MPHHFHQGFDDSIEAEMDGRRFHHPLLPQRPAPVLQPELFEQPNEKWWVPPSPHGPHGPYMHTPTGPTVTPSGHSGVGPAPFLSSGPPTPSGSLIGDASQREHRPLQSEDDFVTQGLSLLATWIIICFLFARGVPGQLKFGQGIDICIVIHESPNAQFLTYSSHGRKKTHGIPFWANFGWLTGLYIWVGERDMGLFENGVPQFRLVFGSPFFWTRPNIL